MPEPVYIWTFQTYLLLKNFRFKLFYIYIPWVYPGFQTDMVLAFADIKLKVVFLSIRSLYYTVTEHLS